MKVIEGKTKGKGKRIAIVVSKFNDFITKRLFDGCLDELKKCKVAQKDITVAWVPGAYEIPVAALHLAQKKNIDAVIALGAVIRGETIHFELISQGAAQGITDAALMTKKPIIFGVITTETVDQAYRRTEDNGNHKGRDAAEAALEMIDLLKQIKSVKKS